jgi:hypothetical protein
MAQPRNDEQHARPAEEWRRYVDRISQGPHYESAEDVACVGHRA